MIIRGLENIVNHMEDEEFKNKEAWYKRHPEITRGIRPDVYTRIVQKNVEKQRIRELEAEVARLKQQREDEYHSRMMYEAMGPEYDENAFAMFP